METFYIFFQQFSVVSTPIVKKNTATLFCCDTKEMTCGLQNFSICMEVSLIPEFQFVFELIL